MAKLTKRQRTKRDKVAEGIKKHRRNVDNPFAVATAVAQGKTRRKGRKRGR